MKWKKRIISAVKNGKFSKLQADQSRKWNTCAVGEHFQLTKLSRQEAEEKVWAANDASGRGKKIFDLGAEFEDAITSNHPERAEEILSEIQEFKPTL